MARIISIVNQKGGTGKSACTANLAVGLAQKNMKVLIVDADPQSDVSAGFGYRDCDDSNETLTALMDAVMKDEDIPSDCYIRHQKEGIDIICSNIGLAGTVGKCNEQGICIETDFIWYQGSI
jgi:chromosome partitioning protein